MDIDNLVPLSVNSQTMNRGRQEALCRIHVVEKELSSSYCQARHVDDGESHGTLTLTNESRGQSTSLCKQPFVEGGLFLIIISLSLAVMADGWLKLIIGDSMNISLKGLNETNNSLGPLCLNSSVWQTHSDQRYSGFCLPICGLNTTSKMPLKRLTNRVISTELDKRYNLKTTRGQSKQIARGLNSINAPQRQSVARYLNLLRFSLDFCELTKSRRPRDCKENEYKNDSLVKPMTQFDKGQSCSRSNWISSSVDFATSLWVKLMVRLKLLGETPMTHWFGHLICLLADIKSKAYKSSGFILMAAASAERDSSLSARHVTREAYNRLSIRRAASSLPGGSNWWPGRVDPRLRQRAKREQLERNTRAENKSPQSVKIPANPDDQVNSPSGDPMDAIPMDASVDPSSWDSPEDESEVSPESNITSNEDYDDFGRNKSATDLQALADQSNSTANDDCPAWHEEPEMLLHLLGNVIFTLLYAFIFVFGFVGNMLALYAMYRKGSRIAAQDIFIANLAFSDIMLCLFAVPITPTYILYHRRWKYSSTLCKLVAFAQSTGVYVSTFTLVCIAYTRHQLIVYPHKSPMTIVKSILLSLVTWAISVSITFPYIDHVNLGPKKCPVQYCIESWPTGWHRFLFSVFTLAFQFLIPLIGVTFFYGSIFRKLKQQKTRRDQLEVENSGVTTHDHHSTSRKNSLKLEVEPIKTNRFKRLVTCFKFHKGDEKNLMLKARPSELESFVDNHKQFIETELNCATLQGVEEAQLEHSDTCNKDKLYSSSKESSEAIAVSDAEKAISVRGSLEMSHQISLATPSIGSGDQGHEKVTNPTRFCLHLGSNTNHQQVDTIATTSVTAVTTTKTSIARSHQLASGPVGHSEDILVLREQRRKNRDKRTGKTNSRLVYMVGLFVGSWFPLNAFNLAQDYSEVVSRWEFVRQAFTTVHIISCTSVCFNPVLYARLSDDFRQELYDILPDWLAVSVLRVLGGSVQRDSDRARPGFGRGRGRTRTYGR